MASTSTLDDAGNDQQLQEEQRQRNNKDAGTDEEQVRGDLKLSLATTISAATCLFSIFVAELSSPEDSHKHKQKNICVSFLIATISSGAAAIILAKQYHRVKVPIEILIKSLTYTSLVCLIIMLGYVGFVLVKFHAVAALLFAIFLPTLLQFVAFRFYKKINEAGTKQDTSSSSQRPRVTTNTESTEHTTVAIAVNEEKEDVD